MSSIDDAKQIDFEIIEDLTGDEPLETSDHVLLGEPLGHSPSHVVARPWVVAQPDDGNHVKSSVGLIT